MALSANSIPMRWFGGPLDSARRERAGEFTAQARQTLQRWQVPEALEILKGTPVNCLIVTWAAGMPQDSEQQKTLAPLIEAGRKLGISFVGWVEGGADADAAIGAARKSGLEAVAIEGYKGDSAFPVLPWSEREKISVDSAAPVLPVTGNVWPGVQTGAAGATGIPWLDSNCWYARLARAGNRASIWLLYDPPGKGTVNSLERYVIAVADAEAAGAHWPISLDDDLQSGLAGKEPRALETWKAITRALAFFASRNAWRDYRSTGAVGVISDFTDVNYHLSGEILNLMTRRHLCHRAIWKSRAMESSFAGLRALVYADLEPPEKELRQKLLAFVQSGGLLLTNAGWGSEGTPVADNPPGLFALRTLGKGRLAIAKEELGDAYLVAQDTHLLLSHANDYIRLYNPGATGSNYNASPDGKKAVLHLVNYTGREGNPVAVWTSQKVRRARLWNLGASEPVPLKQMPVYDGVEFHLTPLPTYTGLDFDL